MAKSHPDDRTPMTSEHQLLIEMLKLTKELNFQAEQLRDLDPLLELSFILNITCPDVSREEPNDLSTVRVEFVIVRSSGHGVESSYLIQDRISMTLWPNRAEDIVFERDYDREDKEDRNLTQKEINGLITQIREFCDEILPNIETVKN